MNPSTIPGLGRLHWYHWLILTLSLVLTFTAWFITHQQAQEKYKRAFSLQVERSLSLINDRMQKYEDALWAGVATIQVLDGQINREQWGTYYKNLDIDKKYPGISGVGVIHYVTPQKLNTYLDFQKQLMPDFKIHPRHDKKVFWPISYIEPQQKNLKAVGLDMAHENNRYSAAKKSMLSAKAQITGPIVLVQDAGKTSGFLFFVPFF